MTEVQLDQHASGTLLPVQALPKARRNAITGVHAGRLKVAVTAAPEKGKANTAIVRLLAAALGLSRSEVTLHSGETSSRKKILIGGMSPSRLRERLAAILQNEDSSP